MAPNRVLTKVRAPAPSAPARRPVLDATIYEDMPLTEQELARLHHHPHPFDSYLNDTIVDWTIAELLRAERIPETSLVFGGRFLARLMQGMPDGEAVSEADARAAYSRVERWLRRTSRTQAVDPFARDVLFFLDNQAEGHWRLLACFNPAALLAAPTHLAAEPGGAQGAPGDDRTRREGDSLSRTPSQRVASRATGRLRRLKWCGRCGSRMPSGGGQCGCHEWLDSDDSYAYGWSPSASEDEGASADGGPSHAAPPPNDSHEQSGLEARRDTTAMALPPSGGRQRHTTV